MKPSKDLPGVSHPDSGLQIIDTSDGSPTLFSTGFQASYHSMHGAFQESCHVFIKNGLLAFAEKHLPQKISIFEMGFGTGFNAWLTMKHCPSDLTVSYTAIEKYPVPLMIVESISAKLIGHPYFTNDDHELFLDLHRKAWGQKHSLGNNLTLKKLQADLKDFNPEEYFDLIYFDAFGPGTQPELWGEEIMNKLYRMLAPKASLVTYCAQGQFRRALVSAGFLVEKLAGPPGKREMVRAWKDG